MLKGLASRDFKTDFSDFMWWTRYKCICTEQENLFHLARKVGEIVLEEQSELLLRIWGFYSSSGIALEEQGELF